MKTCKFHHPTINTSTKVCMKCMKTHEKLDEKLPSINKLGFHTKCRAAVRREQSSVSLGTATNSYLALAAEKKNLSYPKMTHLF